MIIGNFIADFIKGNQLDKIHPDILRGVKLHRAIDTFTDSHLRVDLAKSRLRPHGGKYSGVFLDLAFDHFLAREWNSYSDIPLKDFSREFYQLMNRNREQFPDRLFYIFPYIESQNWLLSYAELNGLKQAVNGMSRRASKGEFLLNAFLQFEKDYDIYSEDFNLFFPDLQAYVKGYLNSEM